MLAFLTTKVGTRLAAAAAVLLGIAVVLLKAFAAGKAAERTKTMKRNLEVKDAQLRAGR